jgi:hypothetical protein
MLRRNRELWYALAAMVAITAVYLWVVGRSGVAPAASSLFGHGLGIAGIVLMLMTETLYSLRKRSRLAQWGRMSSWLRFHIFTGLVGPTMVLLHTAWTFRGLAGVVTALMVVVVFSGIVGRYIYTAVPRTAEGAEVEAADLERQIAQLSTELQGRSMGSPLAPPLVQETATAGPGLVLGRSFLALEDRRKLWRWERSLDPSARAQAREMNRLLLRRRALQRQVASLATARRTLATWHAVHIPIGMVLFAAAFFHAGAAFYYATLLK